MGTPVPQQKGSDGSDFWLREARPDDAMPLLAFIDSLSYASRYFRFGKPDVHFDEQDMRAFCTPDPARRAHWLALAPEEHGEQIVGSARVTYAEDGAAELTIAVGDDWQRKGIGHELVRVLIDTARARPCREVWARILGTNRNMLQFMSSLGFEIADSPEGSWLKIARLPLK